ncbi:MAG: CHAT domain-containing protein [Cyclobacteriaceae bacterium]
MEPPAIYHLPRIYSYRFPYHLAYMFPPAMAKFILIPLLLVSVALCAQKIPQHPNQIVDGEKQGLWTVLVDQDWKQVTSVDQAAYYRIIEYQQGNPVGTVRDYFVDGRLQWQGQLLSENPDVNDGLCIWYNTDGSKKEEFTYKNGIKEGVAVYYWQGKKYSEGTFTKDKLNTDWVYYGNDYNSYYKSAVQSSSNGEFEKAVSNFLKAKPLAIQEYGSASSQHINVVWNLTFAYQSWDKPNEMISSWRETMSACHQSKKVADRVIAQYTEGLAMWLNKKMLKKEANELFLFAAHLREAKNIDENFQLYWDWKTILDNKRSLGQSDSIHFLYEKVTAAVPVADNGNAGALRDWITFAINSNQSERYPDLEKRCEAFLRAKEDQRDGAFAEVAIAHGRLLTEVGQMERALKSLTEAQTIYQKSSETFTGWMRTMRYMLETYNKSKNIDAAAKEILAVFEMNNEKIQDQWKTYTNNLETIATSYTLMKEYDKAEKLVVKMMYVMEKNSGKNTNDYKNLEVVLRALVVQTGHTELLNEVTLLSAADEQMVLKTLGVEEGDIEKLGAYLAANDYLNAIKVFEKSASVIGNFYVSRNEYSAYVLMNLGMAHSYREVGNLARSFQMLNEAYAISKQNLKPEDDSNIIMLMSMGEFRQLNGSVKEASNYYSEALRILDESRTEANKKGNDEMYYNIASRLASTYATMGYYNDAEKIYFDVLDYKAEVNGVNSELYAIQKTALASLYFQMQLFALAEKMYLEAERVLSIKGSDYPAYIDLLNRMAVNYQVRGNYQKAEAIFNQLLEVYTRTLGKQSVSYENVLGNLGLMYYHQGDFDKAKTTYDESNERLLTRIDNFFSALSEEEKTKFYNSVKVHFNTYNAFVVANASEHPQELGNMYSQALLTKGLLFRSGNKMRESILASNDEQLKADYTQWQANKGALAKVYQMSEGEKKDAGIDVERLENEALQLERALTKKSQQFGDLVAARPSWKDVQQKLREGEAAVEIIRVWESRPDYEFQYIGKGLTYDTLGEQGFARVTELLSDRTPAAKAGVAERDVIMAINGKSTKGQTLNQIGELLAVNPSVIKLKKEGAKSTTYEVKLYADSVFKRVYVRQTIYAALVITKETVNQPKLVRLPNGDQLEGRYLKYYRNAIQTKLKDELSYNQFWKPIQQACGNAKTVYVSPDGVYNLINVNTLFNPETEQYVIDEQAIQLVANTSDLLNPTPVSRPGEALLIGFPDYNQKTETVSGNETTNYSLLKSDTTQRFMSGSTVTELPGTKIEINGIEAILKKQKVKVEKWLSSEATEENIKEIHSPKILHIATHGFFMSEVSGEGERSLAGMDVAALNKNPLFRSGLLLAGAGKSIASGKALASGEDGIFTAYEAMNLDLQDTDLVVMSACETGLGTVESGEGVYGLPRAFRSAGANSVLMSLWKVDDTATQELMTEFYKQWQQRNKQVTFRQAQQVLRQKFDHPFYWGAFIMIGN